MSLLTELWIVLVGVVLQIGRSYGADGFAPRRGRWPQQAPSGAESL